MNAGIASIGSRFAAMPVPLRGDARIITGPLHPEAVEWLGRVIANGGSVGSSTVRAVSSFCRSIDAANLRDRFFRLSLMCGNNLASALVPLYRGPSPFGNQYGNRTDTNANFVSGDYVETGPTGGLLGNTTNKSLDTGLSAALLPFGNIHLSAYAREVAFTAYAALVGAYAAGGLNGSLGQTQSGPGTRPYFAEGITEFVEAQTVNVTGLFLGASTSVSDRTLYLNGVQSGVSTAQITSTSTYFTRSLFVFAYNTPNASFNNAVRIASYSIGIGMTATQVASYYAILQAFQTALERQV